LRLSGILLCVCKNGLVLQLSLHYLSGFQT
jgi:hypothetical protein